MAAYYGVMRDKHVEFEGDVPLAEGTQVEVWPRRPAEEQAEWVVDTWVAPGLNPTAAAADSSTPSLNSSYDDAQ